MKKVYNLRAWCACVCVCVGGGGGGGLGMSLPKKGCDSTMLTSTILPRNL